MLLKATYPRAASLLEDYLETLPMGGLFVPTTRGLHEGHEVVVSVRLGRRASPVLLRGVVAWRRTGKHSTKTRAGVGVSSRFIAGFSAGVRSGRSGRSGSNCA
jgi:Tfp pilus assembly protein PilZ